MKKIFLASLMLLFAVVSFAQTSNPQAKAIVDKSIAAIKNGAYEGGYTMEIAGPNGKVRQTLKGTFRIWNEKFYFKFVDTELFFDGKTQWTYVKELNEVTIAEPTAEEIAETSPLMMVKGYSKGHRVQFDEQESDDLNYYVSVYPTDRDLDYFRVQLVIAKKGYQVKEMVMSQRNGDRIKLTLNNFKSLAQPNAAMFAFDKSAYKGVSVTDLR